MFTLNGSGVGTGIAIGNAYVFQRSVSSAPSRVVTPENVDGEIALLDRALRGASNSLKRARDDLQESSSVDVISFIDAHLLMVEDPSLRQVTVGLIRSERYSAETALMIHRNQLVEIFEAMEDDYLRSKKSDVDQVIDLIYRQIFIARGEVEAEFNSDMEGCILVTHDLTPADTVHFMKLKMRAFVTNLGSPISHVAILARSLQVPAVVGMHGAIRHIPQGATIAVDSRTGEVIVEPDADTLDALYKLRDELEQYQQELFALHHVRPRTQDGKYITLLANVELPADIEMAQQCGATGVGLYRTEYLFINRKESPNEEEQFEAYSEAVQKLKNVTIRTLDLGADKQVDGGRIQGNVAINPALGIRAVRFCLRSPGVFRSQLRAIFRASVFGNVQCMIPMLSNLDELRQVLFVIEGIKQELISENIEFDDSIPIGGMIEVPAAAVTADQFAQHLDFLSIGTNDLIQYTLAIDRVDDEVNYLYDPLHPSILRLVKYTIEAGAKFEKPVSLCGEMASDINYTRLLLGLGLKIFSTDPVALPEVKQIIRNSNVGEIVGSMNAILDNTESGKRLELLQILNQPVEKYKQPELLH